MHSPGATPLKLRSLTITVLESRMTTSEEESPFLPSSTWLREWGLGTRSLTSWSTRTRLYKALQGFFLAGDAPQPVNLVEGFTLGERQGHVTPAVLRGQLPDPVFVKKITMGRFVSVVFTQTLTIF